MAIVQPYVFFGGRCEEALEFYKKAIGAEVEMVMKHGDAPQKPPPGVLAPGYESKVMHSSFKVGQSTIMASDGCSPGQKYDGFSLSLTVDTEAQADRAFAALSDGGKVTMPLAKTFWSPKFGMCTDKFGIGWMVNVMHK
jgi:PhnB protein